MDEPEIWAPLIDGGCRARFATADLEQNRRPLTFGIRIDEHLDVSEISL